MTSPKKLSDENIEYIKKNYKYEPETGLIWSEQSQKYLSSKNAGGYPTIRTKKFQVLAHRVAWFLFYGDWPNGSVDHKDRNTSNNAISNLRILDRSHNAMNGNKANNGSRSKYRGVSWSEDRQVWQSYTYKNGKHIYIGSYDTEKGAARGYLDKVKELYPTLDLEYPID